MQITIQFEEIEESQIESSSIFDYLKSGKIKFFDSDYWSIGIH